MKIFVSRLVFRFISDAGGDVGLGWKIILGCDRCRKARALCRLSNVNKRVDKWKMECK